MQKAIWVVSDYNGPILLATGCARFPNQEVSDSMRRFCANLYTHTQSQGSASRTLASPIIEVTSREPCAL